MAFMTDPQCAERMPGGCNPSLPPEGHESDHNDLAATPRSPFGKFILGRAEGINLRLGVFYRFGAGAEKFASYGASVGVHGASDKNGQETDGLRDCGNGKIVKELGVPADIIGRMVVTAPDQMVWLSPNNQISSAR